MSENHFSRALQNFTMDAACGDAIRHLTDKGYTPVQIKDMLTFPAPMKYIIKVMWERLIETHRILLSDPAVSSDQISGGASSGTEIVEHRDSYGRKSFLRIKKESPEETIISPEDYTLCNFSTDPEIPWPDITVWAHRDLISLFLTQESS